MAAQGQVELVGRAAELDRLTALLAPDADPGPVGVLLAGDAGMGKSRLLAEACARAADAGWLTVVGHCLDVGDGGLPYLPFSEIVGRLGTLAPEVVEEVVGSHPALEGLRSGRRAPGDAAPSVARTDLLEAVHALLDRTAGTTPLLVVIEDAHWADRSTRELVGFLLRRPFATRVALMVSYRSDDLHRRHPLRPVVAEWSRVPGVERLHLEPLDPAQVAVLVARLHPGRLSPEQVAAIVDRADGNSFFVEELVRAEQLGRPPADLADVLMVRLDGLDETARAVVRAASAAGRRVGHDVLARVTDLDAGALEASLRAALDAHVLVVEGPGYAFRHALLAEAAYDDLLPGERVRLHARYADALREDGARGTAAELARHARLAGDVETAIRSGIRAADEARSVGGPDEAATHYSQALELLAGHPMAEVDLTRLSVEAADALVESGQSERAAALLRDRLARTDDPDDRVRLLAARVEALLVYEADEDVVAVAATAVDLVGEEPTELRARALAASARARWGFGRDGAEPQALEALRIAEGLGLSGLANEVRMTLVGLQRTGPRAGLRESLTAAVAAAHASGALWAEVRGRFLMARSYQDWGEFAEAQEWFASVVELGGRSGAPWAPFVADARYHLANVAWVRGDWDAALATLDVTGEDPPPVYRALMTALRLTVLAARGQEVEPAAGELRATWPLDGAIVVFAAPLAMASAAAAGDVRAVVGAYDEAVVLLSRMWEPWFPGRLRLATTALAHLTDLLPARPRAERTTLLGLARRLAADALETRDHAPVSSGGWGPEGDAWLLLREAEVRRLHWAADDEPVDPASLTGAWRAAAEAFTAYGQPGEEARVRAVLAGILRATGDATAARAEGDRARGLARALGAQPVLDRLREQPGGPADAPGPLTPREREIIGLVAQGRTNGEIGRLLFISTKTASVHVSNILGKLGAASRTEAAALARRQGLLPDD